MGGELISPHQQMLPDFKGSFGEEWVSEVAGIMLRYFLFLDLRESPASFQQLHLLILVPRNLQAGFPHHEENTFAGKYNNSI